MSAPDLSPAALDRVEANTRRFIETLSVPPHWCDGECAKTSAEVVDALLTVIAALRQRLADAERERDETRDFADGRWKRAVEIADKLRTERDALRALVKDATRALARAEELLSEANDALETAPRVQRETAFGHIQDYFDPPERGGFGDVLARLRAATATPQTPEEWYQASHEASDFYEQRATAQALLREAAERLGDTHRQLHHSPQMGGTCCHLLDLIARLRAAAEEER